jgi:hypothetical protein
MLSSLLSRLGLAKASHSDEQIQWIDPSKLIYSIPTISTDLPPLEPLTDEPASTDLLVYEDNWSQIEFFPRSRLDEIKAMLRDYKAHEAEHRLELGWRQVYVRKISRHAVIDRVRPIDHLAEVLGTEVGRAPIVVSSGEISGRVVGGFTFHVGTRATIYGQASPTGVLVLGASMDEGADSQALTQASIKLNHSDGLVLVDWLQQFVLVSVESSESLQIWRP